VFTEIGPNAVNNKRTNKKMHCRQ